MTFPLVILSFASLYCFSGRVGYPAESPHDSFVWHCNDLSHRVSHACGALSDVNMVLVDFICFLMLFVAFHILFSAIPFLHLQLFLMIVCSTLQIPSLGKILDKRVLEFGTIQKEFLAREDAGIVAEMHSLYTAVCAWMVKMENLSPGLPLPELLELQSGLLIKGVLFAYQVSHILKTFLNMHMVRHIVCPCFLLCTYVYMHMQNTHMHLYI